MRKVILIRPKNIYHYNNYPPLGLISIGTKLAEAGFEVKIINSALEPDIFKTLARELPSALMVGVSMLTAEIPDGYQIVKYIGEKFSVPVVVGGMHATLFPEQMIRDPHVDYVIAGEGEDCFLQLAQSILKRQVIDQKIFYKKTIDLESLPCPDYSLEKDLEKFITGYLTDKCVERIKLPLRWLPYESSRGCPSHCTFCINVVTGNTRYRKKTAAKVIQELSHIIPKYHISHLKIIDDNFFVDVKRVEEIAEGIIDNRLAITWDAECRCDYFHDNMLNDRVLSVLKESGLVQLTLGIESGSSRTLKIMKKEITPEEAEAAVRRCDQHGIIARSSFIIETPGETLGDIKQTIKFINRLRRYKNFTCGVTMFRPYPKCELTEKLRAEGYLSEPQDLKGWTNKDIIDLYTSTELMRPWQVNPQYSERAAYYLNMESAVRLGNYQIQNKFDRLKNRLFIALAKFRNCFSLYCWPLDIKLYQRFLSRHYARKQKMELQTA